MSKGPFSLYDFLGYFVPGALALFFIILGQKSLFYYFEIQQIANYKKEFVELPFYLIVFYIIICYCLGHFLSYFSTLTIEAYTIWMYGYPSKNLLGVSNHPDYKSYIQFLKNDENKKPISKLLMSVLLLPLIIMDFIFGYLCSYNSVYTKKVEEPCFSLIRKKITKIFNELGYEGDVFDNKEHDFNRVLIHYNYEHTVNHGHKLMNYVSLYGFLRVASLIINFLAFFFLFHFMYGYDFTFRDINMESVVLFFKNLFIIISTAFISYMFYMGYLKFYKRYTLENLMLALVVQSPIIKETH